MLSDLRLVKWVKFFEWNCNLLALRLLLENLKLKKTSDYAHWNVWTNIKKVVCPKKYVQKKNSKYEILNHLYFGPNFVLWRVALGRFSQCFVVVVVVVGQPWWPRFSLSPLGYDKNLMILKTCLLKKDCNNSFSSFLFMFRSVCIVKELQNYHRKLFCVRHKKGRNTTNILNCNLCVCLKSIPFRNWLCSSSFLHQFSGITGKCNG